MNRVQKTICIRFTGVRIIVVIELLIIKLNPSFIFHTNDYYPPVLLDGNYLGRFCRFVSLLVFFDSFLCRFSKYRHDEPSRSITAIVIISSPKILSHSRKGLICGVHQTVALVLVSYINWGHIPKCNQFSGFSF